MVTQTIRSLASTQYRQYYRNGVSAPGVNSAGTFLAYTGELTKDDGATNWRHAIKAGANATSNMSFSGYRVIQRPYSFEYGIDRISPPISVNDHLYRRMEGFVPVRSINSHNPPAAIHSTSADNQALSNLYSNLAAVETAFKGMVFTGELRESLEMIKKPAMSFRRGLGGFLGTVSHRSRGTPRRRLLDMVSGTWLEYSFGWKPLISDLDSAVSAFYKSSLTRPIFTMVRGRGRFESPISTGTAVWNSGEAVAARGYTQRGNFTDVKYYGIYRSTGSGVSNLHHYGFSPSEFIPTLWELIPYSFLVDYFTNIGKILESWSYRSIGMDWTSRTRYSVGYDRTIGTKVEDTSSDIQKLTHKRWVTPGSLGHNELQLVLLDRQRSVGLSVPTLELKVPGSWSKWANLVALGSQHDTVRRSLR